MRKDKVRCEWKRRNGEQCGSWAPAGKTFCRYHDPEINATPPTEGRGAPLGNTNSRKAGGITSLRMLPEEEAAYHKYVEEYSADLGEMDAYDRRLVHQLALLFVKIDFGLAARGARADRIAPFMKLAMEHMRELKATRASRETPKDREAKPPTVAVRLFLESADARRVLSGPNEPPAIEATAVEVTGDGQDGSGEPTGGGGDATGEETKS